MGEFSSPQTFTHQRLVGEVMVDNISTRQRLPAKDHLGEKGYDEVFGARPLRRVIQDMVENKLSEDLLRGRFQSGDTAIVDVEEGEVVVHPAPIEAISGRE